MLTIGAFSRICQVTKKTLRHYDELGLLQPEYTAENGYRYYTAGQLRTMLLISRLKSYGFSLPEIAGVLKSAEDSYLLQRLAEKRKTLQQTATQLAHTLTLLQQDMDKIERGIDFMHQDIIVSTTQYPESRIFSLRKTIDVADFSELFPQLYTALQQKNLTPVGPPMTLYYDEDFDPHHADVEVAVPVNDTVDGTRMLAGGLHCMATLIGPYEKENFTAIYVALMKWAEENGYHVTNAPFERYVRGGTDCPPEEYVTEIYFPIGK